MPKFASIPTIPSPHYRVDVPWGHVEGWLANHPELNLLPDFQRGHVWTMEQRSAYIEWMLRGGESGKELHFNHPGWGGSWNGEMVIVDGLQRLTSVRMFLKNEVTAFGYRLDEYDDPDHVRRSWNLSFSVRVCNLKTRAEILKWYLDFNSAGTPHAACEIERVKAMLAAEERR